jgi:hypothetical protein
VGREAVDQGPDAPAENDRTCSCDEAIYLCKVFSGRVVDASRYVLPTEAGRSELVNKTTKLYDHSVSARESSAHALTTMDKQTRPLDRRKSYWRPG